MELDLTQELSSFRNPYLEVLQVLKESVRECQQCQVLKQANAEMLVQLEQLKELNRSLKEEYEQQININSAELKQKTVDYNNQLLSLKSDYNNHLFQLKEKYEKALINREGTQYSINLLNQQLQRRQEYLEKLRKMLQKKENQLLNAREQYLVNLNNIKSTQVFDIEGEYMRELQLLKEDYLEGVKNHEDQKLTETRLLKDELRDSIIERDYYIKKFRERLNEKEEFNKSVYESQCNQIQNIIEVLNQQHQKQISFYLDQINSLEQQVLLAQQTISKEALKDLVLKHGGSIFWKEGIQLYTQYNVHDIEEILKDIKEKEFRHSKYLSKRFQYIVKTALVISKFEKQFQFMKQLIEESPNQILKDEFLYFKQEKNAIQKKNSVQFNQQKSFQDNDQNMKYFYQSLSDLNIIQQKNQEIVNEKLVQIFKLQNINKDQIQQIKQLQQHIRYQDQVKEQITNTLEQKQKRIIELQNLISNENKQFTLMLQLKKLELEELIKMNQQQLELKNEDINKLCKDLEYFQTLFNERPSRDEDLKTILTLQNQLQVKSERFNQLQLYIKSQEGVEKFKFSMNGEKVVIDNNFSKLFQKLNSMDQQSTLENSQNSTMRKQMDNSSRLRSNSRGNKSPILENQHRMDTISNIEQNDLSSILQHQKLITRSVTPQHFMNQSRIETEPSTKSRTRFNTIQQDIQINNKKSNNIFKQNKKFQTIDDPQGNDKSTTSLSPYPENQDLLEYIQTPWLQGFKRDVEQSYTEFQQNSSDIFVKKSSAIQLRSQTPQTIRNRLISRKYNNQIKQTQNQKNKQQQDLIDNSSIQEDAIQQISESVNKFNPFIFKIKKAYGRSQTPQQIIKKE